MPLAAWAAPKTAASRNPELADKRADKKPGGRSALGRAGEQFLLAVNDGHAAGAHDATLTRLQGWQEAAISGGPHPPRAL